MTTTRTYANLPIYRPEPVWLSKGTLIAIHDKLLFRYGGLEGIRNKEALDAALHAPQSRLAYKPEDASLVKLAALLGLRVATGHAFNDANKRTGAVATTTFLGLNGVNWKPKLGSLQVKLVDAVKSSQASRFDEEDCLDNLALWINMSVME